MTGPDDAPKPGSPEELEGKENTALPGTEGHPGYKNYRFHLIAFLKGMLYVTAGSVLFAGFIEGIALIL